MVCLRRSISLLTLAALAASGCAARGPLFRESPPGERSAVIYIYRGREVAEAGSRYDVKVDGEPVAGVSGVKQLGYLYKEVEPGEHRVSSATARGTYTVVIDAEAGRSYYVEISQLSADLGLRPILRTEEVGRSAIADTRYSGL